MENGPASYGRCDLITGTRRLRIVGHGRRLRVRAHGDWGTNPLDGLRECCAATVALDKTLGESIARARSAGFSWADIGRTLGAGENATAWSDVATGLVRNRQAVWGRGLGEGA
jgi:hypothetical protein